MEYERPQAEFPKYGIRNGGSNEPLPILILGMVFFLTLLILSWRFSSDRSTDTAAASAIQARLNTIVIIAAEYSRAGAATKSPGNKGWFASLQQQILRPERGTILATANYWLDASMKAKQPEYAARTSGNAAALFGLIGQSANARKALLRAEKVSPRYTLAYRELLQIYGKDAKAIVISPEITGLLRQLSAGALIRARNAELRNDAEGKIFALHAGYLQGKRVLMVTSSITQIALLLLSAGIICWFLFHKRIMVSLREVSNLKRRPPIWGTGTALIVISFTYALSSLLAGVLTLMLVVFGNMSDSQSQFTPYLVFAISLIASAILIIGLFLVMIGKSFFSWSALGWKRIQNAWWPALSVLFITYPLILIMSYISSRIFADKLEVNPILPVLQSTTNPLQIFVLLLIVVVMAPVIEETLFRGILFPALNNHLPFWWAALISAAVFSVFHTQFGALLPITVLGMIFAFVFRKSNNLWSPVITHAAFNAVSTVVALLLGWSIR